MEHNLNKLLLELAKTQKRDSNGGLPLEIILQYECDKDLPNRNLINSLLVESEQSGTLSALIIEMAQDNPLNDSLEYDH